MKAHAYTRKLNNTVTPAWACERCGMDQPDHDKAQAKHVRVALGPPAVEAIELAIRYLEHPDVVALDFALPVGGVSRALREIIEANNAC